MLLSVVGLALFVWCGLGALGPNRASADPMLELLIGWGAVVLAFIGGLQWGLVMREPETDARARDTRIGLAMLPLLAGWLALVLRVVAASWLALLLLIAAFGAALAIDHYARRGTKLPGRYLWVRWTFTAVATAMLITVLVLRLLGQTITF